jgi:hypothetical protein
MVTPSFEDQLALRIVDMHLESAQCFAAAIKRANLRPAFRESVERQIRQHHGLAAFTEPDPVVAFAELTLLDPRAADFRERAEPLMRRIRNTRYLIPSAWAQEILASLPEKCWNL